MIKASVGSEEGGAGEWKIGTFGSNGEGDGVTGTGSADVEEDISPEREE